MKVTSIYWDMIKDDNVIILFNSLRDACTTLNRKIVESYFKIYYNCNRGFSNLLSGNRVMITIHNDDYRDILGFGSNGFGVTSYSHGTLDYNSENLRTNKKVIVANDYRFRARVKKSSQYRDMFEITLNALKKVPDVKEITNIVTCDIERKTYEEAIKYKGIRTESLFGRYSTNFTAVLINAEDDKSYRNYNLTCANVQQDVELYHVYEETSKLLKKHLKDMTLLNNKLNRYKKSDVYKKLVDELNILEVTRNI